MSVSLVKRYDREEIGTVGTSEVTHDVLAGASYYMSKGMALRCGRTADKVTSHESGRVTTVTCGGCRKSM